ncbi:MAG: hypothetical protein HGA37_08265 [Lentimicrobium sp.]|nr:hypothetical protein [Lentimicrobium sp.]
MIKPATTIDEVISVLNEIIDREVSLNSPLAYFPALYRLVTVRVKNGLTKNEFEDPLQMEQLDVRFANRYITAYQHSKSGKPITGSWRIAFEAPKNNLLILQHLLLGMNAHINLDLGIAAAGIMEGKPLAGLESDFNTINRILAEMSDKVQSGIGKVSPLIGLLDRLAGNSDAMLVKFSITEARDGAWKSANEFHASANDQALLLLRDKKISALGLALIYPNSKWIRTLVTFIRLAETSNVKKVVGIITA